MNLIYINHYSGSELEPREWRPYYLSKALYKEGLDVSVICASFHHLHKKSSFQKESVKSKLVEGVNFIWLKTSFYKGNGFGRIKNMIQFGFKVFKYDPVRDLNLKKPDAIIISSAHPFHILGGLRWAKKYDAKLIFEVRDAWPLSLNLLVGLHRLHPLSILLEFFQFVGLKFSDKVIALPGGLKSYFETKGMKAEKFIHVCNGIDPTSQFNAELDIGSELAVLRDKYKRIVMYAGSLGVPNAFSYCIDAMNQIADPSIALIVVGEGSEKSKLIEKSINPNVYFFDSVPKNAIQSLLSFADICVISWLDLPLYKFGISPNKLFDYMYAAKPIINAVNSDYSITGDCDCGMIIAPENIELMKNAIITMSELSDEELMIKGCNGKQHVLKYYTYEKLAKKVIDEALI